MRLTLSKPGIANSYAKHLQGQRLFSILVFTLTSVWNVQDKQKPKPCTITLQWHRKQAQTWGSVAESGCCHIFAKLTENQSPCQPTRTWHRRVFFFSLVCPKFLAKSLFFARFFILYKQRKRLNASFVAARLCLHMEHSWKIALLAFSIVVNFHTHGWISQREFLFFYLNFFFFAEGSAVEAIMAPGNRL